MIPWNLGRHAEWRNRRFTASFSLIFALFIRDYLTGLIFGWRRVTGGPSQNRARLLTRGMKCKCQRLAEWAPLA